MSKTDEFDNTIESSPESPDTGSAVQLSLNAEPPPPIAPEQVPGAFKDNSRSEDIYERGKNIVIKREKERQKALQQFSYTFKPKINKFRKKSSIKTSPEEENKARFEKLYEHAEETRKKLTRLANEQKRNNTPTFQPKTNSRKGSGHTSSNRFHALYESARESQKKLEEKRASYKDKECTFEPKINSSKLTGNNTKKRGQTRLNELYEQGKKKYQDREEAKEALQLNLTFTPCINKRSNSALSPTDSLTNGSIRSVRSDGLHLCPSKEEIQQRNSDLEARKVAYEMKGCTFTPAQLAKRIEKTDTENSKSKQCVHKRLYENAKSIREKHDMMRDKLQNEVSQKQSARKPSNDSCEGSVFNRLYQNSLDWQKTKSTADEVAKQRRQQAEWEENKKECTFNPEISYTSKTMDQYFRGVDTFTRLYIDAEIRKNKKEIDKTETEQKELDLCTFQPNINPNSISIIEKQRSDSCYLSDSIREVEHGIAYPKDNQSLKPNESSQKPNPENTYTKTARLLQLQEIFANDFI